MDESWEYWEPDPEIAEVMGSGRSVGFGGLPRGKCERTGRHCLDGYRVGKGDPDRWHQTRLGKPPAERPGRLPLTRCRHCTGYFTPRKPTSVYCSKGCRKQDQFELVPRPCETCGEVFKPLANRQRYCDQECSGVAISAMKTGRSVSLDWDRVCELYAGGATLADIARTLGANRASVRVALQRRGVYRGAEPGRRRVLPDVVCSRPECGRLFRPRCVRHRMFCSVECDKATRDGRHKPVIDRQRVLEMHQAGMSNAAIARELGHSDTGVGYVLRMV